MVKQQNSFSPIADLPLKFSGIFGLFEDESCMCNMSTEALGWHPNRITFYSIS